MNQSEYIKVRKTYAEITSHIFKYGIENGAKIIDIARLFHFAVGNTLVLESEHESDYIAEYLIFESEIKGQKTIDLFYDEAEDMDSEWEEMLESMVNHRPSLYEVVEINEKAHCVYLKDLLNKSEDKFELLDLNFSKTAANGLLVYARLLPIRNTHISSGISFPFSNKFKEPLLKEISFMSFKKGKKIKSAELIVAMYHHSKTIGDEIQFANVLD
ncbi:MAG: hypothetical protein ABI723_14095 [Bacteroidia bacterium]